MHELVRLRANVRRGRSRFVPRLGRLGCRVETISGRLRRAEANA